MHHRAASATTAPTAGYIPPMARRDATTDLLAQVPLFPACSRKELQQLAKLAQDIHVDAGHVVVREGAAGAEFFAIVDGRGRGEPPRQGRRHARAGCVLRRPRAPRQGAPQRDRHRQDVDGPHRARPARVQLDPRRLAGVRAQAARRPRAPPARDGPAGLASSCRNPGRDRRTRCSFCAVRRPKPHQVVLVVGVLAALGTIFSGIFPRLTEWDDDSPIARHVFVNIPDPIYWLFYATVAVMLVLCAALVIATRVRNYERGAPDDRRTTKKNVHRRLRDFRAGVWMRTLMRDPAAGLMHSFIYFGFLVLFAATIILEIDHQLPEDLKFLHGKVYQSYSAIADVFGVVFVVGIAVGDRPSLHPAAVPHPHQDQARGRGDPRHVPRHRASPASSPRASASRTRAGRRSRRGRSSATRSPALVDSWAFETIRDLHRTMWVVHFAAFAAFLVILPTTKLRHMVTSPMNMYLRDKDRPKGAMKPMPNLMETELETFGASTVEDFTWKQLFDTDACTICGRCTSVCPAHATGKPLDPREIVLKVGEVMAATGDPQVSPPVGVDRDITITADSVFERDHVRRAVGVHHVQGVRRDLPGEHRDPRQDPRHAALPLAHGERLPRRARQHVPLDGELVERLRHEPG